jgi:hypothetical protein
LIKIKLIKILIKIIKIIIIKIIINNNSKKKIKIHKYKTINKSINQKALFHLIKRNKKYKDHNNKLSKA